MVAVLGFVLGSNLLAAEATEPATPSQSIGSLNVEQELAEVRKLSEQLNQRIRRLEVLIAYQKAVTARDQSLAEWRTLKVQSGQGKEIRVKETRAEEKFFQSRESAERLLKEFHELSD
jgi:hypothetical protein